MSPKEDQTTTSHDFIMSVREFRDKLSDCIGKVHYGNARILIERRGKPVAALISADELELLTKLEDQMDLKAAKKTLKKN